MKKILFSVLMIGLVLNIVKVSAETCNPDKISIESISIEEKNSNTKELEEVTSTGKNIKLHLSMNEIGDNITYKMKIKNDSSEDYQLGENTFNTETDYIDYSIETEDKDNIIKAQTTETAYLRVEYKNEIPSELIADDSYKENKTITLNASDNGINNPNTKRNIIILLLSVIVIISLVSAAFLSLKNKKYIKPMIVIIGITLPVLVSALCEANIEIDLQLKIEKPCISFNDENSWEKIINSIKNNKTECMNVGDAKTVDLGNLGTHTVRVANKSTPEECSDEEFSQTACGFVVEFADIITTRAMNSNSNGYTDGTGNRGGWELSEMRSYVNNDIYNLLPSNLKDAIIDTRVISGHGVYIYDPDNFKTTDKLYLLSTHEIYEDVDGNPNSGIDYEDTGYNNTKQLDYYNELGVTTSNRSGAAKKYNESINDWWLRTADYKNNNNFLDVGHGGYYHSNPSHHAFGVSPAFRLG